MARVLKRVLLSLVVLGLLAAAAAVAGDRYVARKGLDRSRMVACLAFQNADLPVHEALPLSPLHYRLKAGAVYDSQGQHGAYRMTVNQHHARGTEYPLEKGAGVFRILVFGSSTAFGAFVNDDETIPAALERYLNQHLATLAGAAIRVEVWNFATSAYVPTQSALLAMEKLDTLHPDMIVMAYDNAGRRAFLGGQGAQDLDYLPWFEADPSLWEENFPAPPGRSPALHRMGLKYSAYYRAEIAQQVLDHKIEVGPRQGEEQGRRLSEELVKKTQAAGVQLVVVSWSGENGGRFVGVPPTHLVNTFDSPVMGLDSHPSGALLGQIGVRIGSILLSRGLIPGSSSLQVTPTQVDIAGITHGESHP